MELQNHIGNSTPSSSPFVTAGDVVPIGKSEPVSIFEGEPPDLSSTSL